MEFMPDLHLTWISGGLFLIGLVLTEGILFRLFPKDVVARLFDRSGWEKKQIVFTVIGKVAALGCLILIGLSPLKIWHPVFIIGSIIAICGIAGLIKSLLDFRSTPLDQPVTKGFYTISRHPQIVSSSLVILGACIAIGSWSAVILWLIARIFEHFGILGEEEVCLRKYGEAYRQYLEHVPRYFLFF